MALIPTATIEQAALNALGRWLGGNLSGVTVNYVWPSPEQTLPSKAITILRAGPREDEYVDPVWVDNEPIHAGVTAFVSPSAPVDLPSSISVVVFLAASYTAHIADTTVHQAADTVNVLTAPAAHDLPSAIARAEDLRAKLNAHEPDPIPHTNGDTQNAVTVPTAVDLPSLIVLLTALIGAMARHYVARIDVWSLRGCRLPVELDVWTTYEAVRDLMLALVEPLLNADPFLSAGQGFFPGQPGHNGVTLNLADGWKGAVDFDFNAPRLRQTDNSQQVSEFRAIYLGFVDFMLLVKAQSSRMATVQLQASIDTASPIRTATVGETATTYTG